MKKDHFLRRLNPWTLFVLLWILNVVFPMIYEFQNVVSSLGIPILLFAATDLWREGILRPRDAVL